MNYTDTRFLSTMFYITIGPYITRRLRTYNFMRALIIISSDGCVQYTNCNIDTRHSLHGWQLQCFSGMGSHTCLHVDNCIAAIDAASIRFHTIMQCNIQWNVPLANKTHHVTKLYNHNCALTPTIAWASSDKVNAHQYMATLSLEAIHIDMYEWEHTPALHTHNLVASIY